MEPVPPVPRTRKEPILECLFLVPGDYCKSFDVAGLGEEVERAERVESPAVTEKPARCTCPLIWLAADKKDLVHRKRAQLLKNGNELVS